MVSPILMLPRSHSHSHIHPFLSFSENVPGVEVGDRVIDEIRLFSLFDVAALVQKVDPNISRSLVSALEKTALAYQK